MLVQHLLDDATAVLGARDVALVDSGASGAVEVVVELLQELLGALAVAAVAGCDRCALAGQAAADRGADAAATAGDQSHLSRQLVAGNGRGPFVGLVEGVHGASEDMWVVADKDARRLQPPAGSSRPVRRRCCQIV